MSKSSILLVLSYFVFASIFAAFNILTVTANREIQVDKSSVFKIKFWAFLGLKIGLRI